MRRALLVLLALTACAPRGDDAAVPSDDPTPTPSPEPTPDATPTPGGPDTDDDTAAPATRWIDGATVTCADPAARAAAPFALHEPPGDWQQQPFDPRSDSLFVGGGVGVADLDGDGLLDLVLSARDTRLRYYGGTPGLGFEDRTDRMPPVPEKTAGVTPVDLEGDGDLDVVITVFAGPNLVMINDGTGTFTEAAEALGLQGDPDNRTMMSSWADVDRDGDLDGFFGGYGRLSGGGGLPAGDPSMLVLRQPDGSYLDVVPTTYTEPHPMLTGHTFGGAFTDADDDGWLDLYVINDFGWRFPSLLMRNDGQGGLWWDDATGAQLRRENMGLGVGDVNGDLVPDFLVAAWETLGLMESRPGGIWVDAAQARGMVQDHDRGQWVAWGAELADVDNDGDLDAAIAYGHLQVRSNNVNPQVQPDALLLQAPDGSFSDTAPAWGLDHGGRGRGFLLVDLDRNGWLDWVRRDLRGPTLIHLARCGDAAWLGLHLRQPGLNPFAVGARVKVTTGDRVQVREVIAGGTSYTSGGPPEVHFGLGDATVIDEVEIRWPDGAVDVRRDVPVNQWATVVRP